MAKPIPTEPPPPPLDQIGLRQFRQRLVHGHPRAVVLRRKIEFNPHNPQLILTAWGVGYKFADV